MLRSHKNLQIPQKKGGRQAPAEALGDGGCLQEKTGTQSLKLVNGL